MPAIRRFGRHYAQEATARERESRALELRKAGYTFDQIARALGITRSAASKAYQRSLSRLPGVKDREELRALEAERIDALFRRKWQAALDGDEKAFDQILRLMARRAKLLGLDDQQTPGVPVLMRYLQQLRALPESDLLDLMGYQGGPDTAGTSLPQGGDRRPGVHSPAGEYRSED